MDFIALDFESAGPSVVKSIGQRDLLNNWPRLFAHDPSLPRVAEYQPERLADLFHPAPGRIPAGDVIEIG